MADDEPLADAVSENELDRLAHSAMTSTHPSFQLAPGVFIEIPPPTWGHGDYLVYLPARHLMVRRNRVDYWYVDIGIFKPIETDLYGWTDLYLDVAMPEPPVRHEVLDADELADALLQGQVSAENAVLAQECMDQFLTLLEGNQRPLREVVPEVGLAEAFYQEFRAAERAAG